ncbi:MAG: hypothetical protein VW080_05105 [Flavobacteriaceae bacterium]
MKSILFSLILLMSLNSCLVIKVYEDSPDKPSQTEKLTSVHRQMIGSGKKVDLGRQGTQEILFFGKERTPKKIFPKEAQNQHSVSLKEKPTDQMLPSETRIWIESPGSKPLLVIDGIIKKTHPFQEGFKWNTIKSIKVLEKEEATIRYGSMGAEGVIEINTRKN